MDLDFYKRLAKALAAEFGENCEVLVHDLTGGDPEHTIVAIENVTDDNDLMIINKSGVLIRMRIARTGRPVTVPPR